SYEFIAELKKIEAIKKGEQMKQPYEVTCTASPNKKVVQKIIVEGKTVGNILLIECKQDIKDDDYDYLILISEIISKVLAQKQFYSNISNVLDEEILYHLLENNIKNKSIIKERLKSNSLVLSMSIEVMVVDISNFKLKKSAYSEELKLGLFDLFSMSESFYYNGNIIIINDNGIDQNS